VSCASTAAGIQPTTINVDARRRIMAAWNQLLESPFSDAVGAARPLWRACSGDGGYPVT